jgi:plasmid stabilization system protein ParE
MAIKIYWTDFSKNELRCIFDYYKTKAGLNIAKKLILGITAEVNNLQYKPQFGQREELLIGRKEEFRYLVFKNYKIIYWFNTTLNRIEITDVFDTRQNPIKIKRN